MKDFLEKITEPIFYITNDAAKAIGVEKLLPNYHIVCLDEHPLVDRLVNEGVKVFCLERTLKQRNKIFRSTSRIIDHPLVLEYIRRESVGRKPHILFFKPSAKIDFVCQKFGFVKIGNSAEINRQFEDKVLFYLRCLKEKIPVPEGEVRQLNKLNFEHLLKCYGAPFVIQFGIGWAGGTTFFIKEKTFFKNLQSTFSNKRVKVTRFIKGKTILNNACVFRQEVFISPPAEQISSITGLTALQGATCGRQWPVSLNKRQLEQVNRLTKKVGEVMESVGYCGYFGLDFVVEDETGKVYLSENNARMTASIPFFTKLEIKAGVTPLLAFHLLSFLKNPPAGRFFYKKTRILGSELVVRNDFDCRVKVQGELHPGIYQFVGGGLKFLKEEYFAKDLKVNEFWLTAVSRGRIVNPEQELIRINFAGEVLSPAGKLEQEFLRTALQAKKTLKLKRC